VLYFCKTNSPTIRSLKKTTNIYYLIVSMGLGGLELSPEIACKMLTAGEAKMADCW
jgi:hypothetical protein